MKKLTLFLLSALCTAATTFAYNFQSGYLYYYITSATTVEVTHEVYRIEANYQGLTTASIPETVTYGGTTYSVTSIGDWAFYGCSSLTSVTIPNSVTSIGDYAFSDCSSLTSITIPNSVTSIGGGAFFYCSSLTSITLPNSVTSIGGSAFSRCSSLTSITIPNSLTSIAYATFLGCTALASVIIPGSVTLIEGYAFAECRKLRHIYCYAATPPTAQANSFANYNVYVHVPCASLDAYDMDAVFGSFKYIECIGSEDADITDKTVTVVPSNGEATFTWPMTDGAETYTLVITKDGVTFCTLVFNAQGQLVSIAFKPARQNAPASEGTTPANYAEQTANGFRFTVIGLNEGTAYAYTLTVRDAANSILETYTGEFTTQSDTQMGIHESAGDNTPAGQAEKILRDGQVLILRNGETYDMMGKRL